MALPVEAGPSPQPVAATQHRVLTGAGNTVIKASIVDSGQTCDYCEAGERGRELSSQELGLRSYIN